MLLSLNISHLNFDIVAPSVFQFPTIYLLNVNFYFIKVIRQAYLTCLISTSHMLFLYLHFSDRSRIPKTCLTNTFGVKNTKTFDVSSTYVRLVQQEILIKLLEIDTKLKIVSLTEITKIIVQ